MSFSNAIQREIAGYEPLDVLLADVAIRIQLSATDYQKAVQHFEAISGWIDRPDSPLHNRVELTYAQGGFAIGATTAKHTTEDVFDIDGMVQLTVPTTIDPDYPLSQLDQAIRGLEGSRYHKKTERKSRCIRVTYDGMHLDMTPTVRILARPERTGLIFHSKVEEPTKRTTLWANPFGFAEWFKAMTPADEAFGQFYEQRSLEFARARARSLVGKAVIDPVPTQLPAYRKSRAVIALQLIKRWRNLAFDRRHRALRLPPSILIAKYVADHANQTRSLADELLHQVESMIVIFDAAERLGRRVLERNPLCPEDILTDRWPADASDQRIFLSELRGFTTKLRRLRAGAPLAEMQKILVELFGERPAADAIEHYIGQHYADRASGQVLYLAQKGRVPPIGSVAAAASTVRATPRNTFFGD